MELLYNEFEKLVPTDLPDAEREARITKLLLAPEPLTNSAEMMSPATISEIVAGRRRAGVSHLNWRVASQARVPLTAAPAVIAVAMHCMHIAPA
jgi:hypothetical protein